MKVRLQVSAEGRPTGVVELEGQGVNIGRDPSCELALDTQYDGVSWRHARLELSPHGAILYDLGSTNGTFVNDVRMEAPTRLSEGDRFRLGLRGPELTLIELVPAAGERKAVPTPIAVSLAAPVRRGSALLPALKPPSVRPTLALRMLTAVTKKSKSRPLAMVAAIAVLVVFLAAAVLLGQLLLSGMSTENKPAEDEGKGGVDKVKNQLDPPAVAEKAAKPGAPEVKGKVDTGPAVPAAAQALYQRAIRSVVLVVTKKGSSAGILLNVEQKFICAPYHVLQGGGEALVYFPLFDATGSVVASGQQNRAEAKPVVAKVVISDAQLDLVVLELDSVPAGFKAMPIADGSAVPGERVHAMSCLEAAAFYWTYASGTVTAVARKEMTLSTGQRLDCWLVDWNNPGLPAESGAPVLNDRGELVAVHTSGRFQAELASSAVDIRELLTLLRRIR